MCKPLVTIAKTSIMNPEKLVRTNDKILTGVCSAISIKTNINASIVRLVFVILGLSLTYIAILIYIILSVTIPYVDNGEPNKSATNYKKLIDTSGLPKWFIYYTYGSLYPILFWPLIFYASIFMFDNPSNFFLTLSGFFAIISYPIILIAFLVFAFRLYRKNNKLFAFLIPLTSIIAGISFVYFLFS
jgi:phage shock protein PspC (stress-responsive transcriptional regulator)